MDINKTSWWYKFYDWKGTETETDICKMLQVYIGKLGLLLIFLFIGSYLTIMGSSVLIFIVDIILNLLSVGGWMLYFGVISVLGMIVTFFIALIVTIIGIVTYKNKLASTPPGVARVMYRSWKDKYCVKVRFVD